MSTSLTAVDLSIPLQVGTCIRVLNQTNPNNGSVSISSQGSLSFKALNQQRFITLEFQHAGSVQYLTVPGTQNFNLTLNPFTAINYDCDSQTWCIVDANTPVTALITSQQTKTAVYSAVIVGVITALTLGIVLTIWKWFSKQVSTQALHNEQISKLLGNLKIIGVSDASIHTTQQPS